MKYKVVLFDADGMTLVQKRFSDQIQTDYGISWEVMKPFFMGPFLLCKQGKADLKKELANVIHDWGWKGTVDELVGYWFRIGGTPNKEVVELIPVFQSFGIRCFLATNQEAYRAEFLRKNVGLERIFDGMFVSAEIGFTKKDPLFFEEAYKRINAEAGEPVQKEEVLFVDHEEESIAAAQAVGFSTHVYHGVWAFQEVVLEA